ncbi:MAG: transposase [Verrucomicrobiales bacterium]
MSKRKRRHLTAEFKARVAKEALKEEQTIQQSAKDNDIAPTQVSAWKKELEERMTEIFERKNAIDEAAQKQENSPHDLSARWASSLSRRNFLKKVRSAGDRSQRKGVNSPDKIGSAS